MEGRGAEGARVGPGVEDWLGVKGSPGRGGGGDWPGLGLGGGRGVGCVESGPGAGAPPAPESLPRPRAPSADGVDARKSGPGHGIPSRGLRHSRPGTPPRSRDGRGGIPVPWAGVPGSEWEQPWAREVAARGSEESR